MSNSTESKHTPGPWIVEAVDGRLEVCNEETLYTVATVFRHEQNARLIAAAPELLEALQFAVYRLQTLGQGVEQSIDLHEIEARATAAIAKATGSQQ